MKKILFRIDNIHASEHIEPGCLLRLNELMNVFNYHAIPVLLAVSPRFGLTEEDIFNNISLCDSIDNHLLILNKYIQTGHYVGLHGVTHRCRVLKESEHYIEQHHPSVHEYRCLDFEKLVGKEISLETQLSWLKMGKNIVERIINKKIDILIPPAHYYGKNTLIAMKKAGFKAITTYDRFVLQPYKNNEGILILPSEFEDIARLSCLTSLDTIKPIIDYCMRKQENTFLQLFFHTKYKEFDMEQKALDTIDYILKTAKQRNYNFIDPASIQI